MIHGRRALFLDRDGVINHDHGYTHRWEQFEFIDGIFDLCRHAKSRGLLLVVATNQAGIGRGFYSENEFLALTETMCEAFRQQGADIDKVYFSPFHPVHGIGRYKVDSQFRKPNPGMLLQAAAELGLCLPSSVLVGDKETDVQAGHAAGVRCNLLYVSDTGSALFAAPSCATARVTSLEQVKPYL